jgi:hypothetical protein
MVHLQPRKQTPRQRHAPRRDGGGHVSRVVRESSLGWGERRMQNMAVAVGTIHDNDDDDDDDDNNNNT